MISNVSSNEKKLIYHVKSGGSSTEKVAHILNIPLSNDWSIVDTEGSLCLVHYSENADMSMFGHLRGVLVDLDSCRILAPSFFGFNEEAVCDHLSVVDDQVSIKDKLGFEHTFDVDQMRIQPVYDGASMRVIWYNSQMYFISHKRINTSRSRWGSSRPFVEMYQDAGGPTAEELFDTSVPESSTCYTFMIVDKDTSVGTRQVINKPYVVCLHKESLETDSPAGKFEFTKTKHIGTVDESFVGESPDLTINEANDFLSSGYSQHVEGADLRSQPGEAVIIYSVKDGKIEDILRVHSTGYNWRNQLRNNKPNVKFQLYTLLGDCQLDLTASDNIELFIEKYLKIDEEINSKITLNKVRKLTPEDLNVDRRDLAKIVYVNYLYSLPIYLRSGLSGALSEFNDNRKELVKFIQDISVRYPNIASCTQFSKNLKNKIIGAKMKAKEDVNRNKRLNYRAKVNEYIYKFTMGERDVLYALIREMNDYKSESLNS